jgi:hypothetical protein
MKFVTFFGFAITLKINWKLNIIVKRTTLIETLERIGWSKLKECIVNKSG